MVPGAVPSSRLAAAVAVSALAHLLIVQSVAPGSSGRATRAPGPSVPSLDARLVFTEPDPPVAEALPEVVPDAPRLAEAARPERARLPPPRVSAASREVSADSAGEPRQAGAEGSAHLPDATYYGARQLDVYPMLATPMAREEFAGVASGARGRVLLLVLIDAAGGVDDVSVVDGGDAGGLEHAARRAFLGARFTPAQRNGRAVKSRIVIEVSYGQPVARVE
jgi:protein TonB